MDNGKRDDHERKALFLVTFFQNKEKILFEGVLPYKIAQYTQTKDEIVSILVTGGAGYIGSHCVARLLEAGEQVVVLDNLSTGFKKLVLTSDFVEADIHDEHQVEAVLKTFDVQTVMHFAASCYVGESVEKPSLYYWNNVSGTISLLRAMENTGVKQLIFSSSCATYGVPEDVTKPIDEETPQNPVNPYGHSKLMVEKIIRDWATEKTLHHMEFKNMPSNDL